MVICLERGADLHTAQLMPLPLTVSRFGKIQIGFSFLVLAHLGSPGKRAVERGCVCVCVCVTLLYYCTYVELGAERAVDGRAEVDEAVVGGNDALDHLPVHVGEHHVLVGQPRTQPVLAADRHQPVEVEQLYRQHPTATTASSSSSSSRRGRHAGVPRSAYTNDQPSATPPQCSSINNNNNDRLTAFDPGQPE